MKPAGFDLLGPYNFLGKHLSHGMRNEMHHGKKPGSKRQSTWRSTKLLLKERRQTFGDKS